MSLAEMVRKSVWGRGLSAQELESVIAQCREAEVAAGQTIVRAGEPALHWLGLVSGVACMSVSMPDGKETSLTSLAAGGWFGEGTLIKRGRWQYDGRALSDCRVALMPLDCFEHLRQTSLPFNHY
ncbi:MAG TPA: cyclic nucleotide-binding domain-containing protein, partial [Burkholderiaceae bacterium]|nr:cyclic nucleotide-binding domain-containing protein [Burkholderiaceae bacterium]